jgi:short-subunit dehydrogenase
VTGASTGIGRAAALALAEKGWMVAATARSEKNLAELSARTANCKGQIHAYAGDVTDRNRVLEQVRHIETEMGPIDLAILNAGTHRPMPAAEFSSDTLRQLFEVNVMGVAHGLEAILPSMIDRRSGRVMIVASVAGYSGLPMASAYGATKAALINMAEAMHPELRRLGVILQLINPGFVKTPLTDNNDFPMPFLISAEEAASAIIKGLESDRFEISFPWFFTRLLKLARMLPYSIYFRIIRGLVRP